MDLLILESPEAHGLFVRQTYANLLGRAPDGSPNFWFSAMMQGATYQNGLLGITTSQEYFVRLTANHNTQAQENAYITAVYHDLLGITIDPTSASIWVSNFEQGLSRLRATELIVNSQKYRDHYITGLFQTLLHRSPSPTDLSVYEGLKGQGESDEQLKATIMGWAEYYSVRGGSTPFGVLDAFYRDALGGPIDAGGVALWGGLLAAGTDRQTIALDLLTSFNADEALAQNYYLAILHRNADPGGASFWATVLQQGFPDEYVAAALAATDEYYGRATGG
jgi:hypothetical protein